MTRRDTLKLLGLLGLRAAFPARVRAIVPVQPPPNDPAVAAATTAFGCDLFAKLRAKSGNLFFSPLSIETALAMTSAGARGETLAEMVKTLHLPNAGAQAGVGDLLRYLQSNPAAKYQLSIANALWLQEGLSFRQEFLTVTGRQYYASMRSVDFRHAEKARQTINHWVEQQTKDKIKDLFGPGSLTADSRLVLTNAVYFKGKWVAPFTKSATRDERFQLADGKTVQVPLMRQGGRYRYFRWENLKAQAVALPYAGGRVEMLILLPYAPDGLPALEKAVTTENFESWGRWLRFMDGNVLLPRFKMADEFNLNDALKEMGMRRAFSRDADFGGMCAEPLLISQVIHKAFVDTNEEGTEAAAATGVPMPGGVEEPEQRFTFRADRPFLFVIRDTGSGTPLFVGRIVNPMA